jgi:4-hydroxy-tetrahydrodipicolinate synthase
MFTGTFTAIVTPFKNEMIDEPALERLIKAQIKGGVAGIIPVGSTGESPTLSMEEHIHVIELAVKFADQKIKVIAGTGANATSEAIFLAQAAEKAGADACLQVVPYYNKPTQDGLFQHFQAISKSTKLPIIVYNIPGRCGVEIAVETLHRLARECKNIVGSKESTGNLDRISQMRAVLGNGFSILCGDDSLTVPFMSVGANGVVSVASNLIPKEMSQLTRAMAMGKLDIAQKIHFKYFQLFRDLFIETNPGPIKAALAMTDAIEEEYRLPMAPMSAKNRETLKATLKACGIL